MDQKCDWTDYLIEERVEQIFNQCQKLREDSIKRSEILIATFQEDEKERIEEIIAEILIDNVQINKTCYAAGFEDGAKLAREILTLAFDWPSTISLP